jgi:hypothetical protein
VALNQFKKAKSTPHNRCATDTPSVHTEEEEAKLPKDAITIDSDESKNKGNKSQEGSPEIKTAEDELGMHNGLQ